MASANSRTKFTLKNTGSLQQAYIIVIQTDNSGQAFSVGYDYFDIYEVNGSAGSAQDVTIYNKNYIYVYVCDYNNSEDIRNVDWRNQVFIDGQTTIGNPFILNHDKLTEYPFVVIDITNNATTSFISDYTVNYYSNSTNNIYYADNSQKGALPEVYRFHINTNVTITFNANGKSNVQLSWGNIWTKQVPSGAKYNVLPTASVTGYTFEGWYTAATGGTKVTSDTSVSSTTLYAHWSAIAPTYTVTFNPNSGEVEPTTKTVTSGQTYGELPTPTRIGYAFAGWYTSISGGTQITSSTTVNLTSNTTLYAHWAEISNYPTIEKEIENGKFKQIFGTILLYQVVDVTYNILSTIPNYALGKLVKVTDNGLTSYTGNGPYKITGITKSTNGNVDRYRWYPPQLSANLPQLDCIKDITFSVINPLNFILQLGANCCSAQQLNVVATILQGTSNKGSLSLKISNRTTAETASINALPAGNYKLRLAFTWDGTAGGALQSTTNISTNPPYITVNTPTATNVADTYETTFTIPSTQANKTQYIGLNLHFANEVCNSTSPQNTSITYTYSWRSHEDNLNYDYAVVMCILSSTNSSFTENTQIHTLSLDAGGKGTENTISFEESYTYTGTNVNKTIWYRICGVAVSKNVIEDAKNFVLDKVNTNDTTYCITRSENVTLGTTIRRWLKWNISPRNPYPSIIGTNDQASFIRSIANSEN